MERDIKVSIVSKTFNHEKFIEDLLEGFLKQRTNFRFEIIIADDCSMDGTQRILGEYASRYPEMIFPLFREKNMGPRRNDIDSLSRARGRYIAICDGDDYWIDENKLQMQADFLDQNPEYGLVHTDNDILYNGSGRIIHSMNRKQNERLKNFEEPLLGILTGEYMIHTLTVMVRKDLLLDAIESDFFKDEENIQGDLIMWLEILGSSRAHYFPVVTSMYRFRRGSLSRQNTSIKVLDYQLSSKRIRMHYAEKYNVPDKIKRKAEQLYYFVILTRSYHLNDRKNGEISYRRLKRKDINSRIMHLGARYRSLKLFIEPVRLTRLFLFELVYKIQGKVD